MTDFETFCTLDPRKKWRLSDEKGKYMSKLLFEEIPNKSKVYMRTHRNEKIVLTVITAVFVLLGVLCLFLKEYFVAIIPFVFALWLSFYLIKAL